MSFAGAGHEHSHPHGHCDCGAGFDDADVHARLGLPDRVLALPERERSPGVGMDNPDPYRAVFLEEPSIGCFVRATQRLPLTEGASLTYGLWIRVSPAVAQTIGRVWRTDEYAQLKFDGWLGNSIAPFGLLGAAVRVEVIAPEELPRVVSSESEALQGLLHTASDRSTVMAALESAGANGAEDGPLDGLDAVLTTRPVAEGHERAKLILHEYDGTWQFIGSTDGTEENAVVMHFSHLLEHDRSLAAAEDLPVGGLMERQFVGWRRVQFASEEEMDAYLES